MFGSYSMICTVIWDSVPGYPTKSQTKAWKSSPRLWWQLCHLHSSGHGKILSWLRKFGCKCDGLLSCSRCTRTPTILSQCCAVVAIVCTQGVAFYLPTFTDPFKGFLPFPFKYDQNIFLRKFVGIGGLNVIKSKELKIISMMFVCTFLAGCCWLRLVSKSEYSYPPRVSPLSTRFYFLPHQPAA